MIEAKGANVKNFAEGDRVTFDSMISCGKCSFCRHGQPNLCDNRQVLGVSCGEYRRHGAFAEYVRVHPASVLRIPPEIDFRTAAMVEPLAVGLHGVRHARLGAESPCVVLRRYEADYRHQQMNA